MPGRVKCGGTEGEIVVAHGRLPSPARLTRLCLSLSILHNLVKTLQFHFKTRFTVRNNNRKTCLPPLVRLMAYSPPTPSLQSKIEGSVNLKYKSTYQGCEMESSHVKGFTPRSWQGYNIRQKFGDRRKDRTSESVYTVSKYLIID